MHQDKSAWLALGLTILGLVLAGYQVYEMLAKPSLIAECGLNEKLDPLYLHCSVENTGRAVATNATVSFKSLPSGTAVVADPSALAGIVRTNSSVDVASATGPLLQEETGGSVVISSDESNKTTTTRVSFSVFLPRVVPDEEITFDVVVNDPENIRAAKQLVFLRAKQKEYLVRFEEIVRSRQDFQSSRFAELVDCRRVTITTEKPSSLYAL